MGGERFVEGGKGGDIKAEYQGKRTGRENWHDKEVRLYNEGRGSSQRETGGAISIEGKGTLCCQGGQ